MNEEGLRQFAAKMGFSLKPKSGKGWMECPCPLAPWTHEKGYDNRPSFAVKINEAGSSAFVCQACKHKGTFANLAYKFFGFTQDKQYQAMGREIEEIEAQLKSDHLPEWEEDEEEERKPPTILDNSAFKSFGHAYYSKRCRAYLADRGIRPWTAIRLGLRHDTQLDRILFPIWDMHQELRGFSGRAMYDDAPIKVKDYFGLDKYELMLGEDRISRDRHKLKFVVIVEGLFDWAKVMQAGLPCMALLGSELTKEKFDKLITLNLPIIWFVDNDAAGEACIYGRIDKETEERDARTGALHRLNQYLPQLLVKYRSHENDPGGMSDSRIRYMVRNAQLFMG